MGSVGGTNDSDYLLAGLGLILLGSVMLAIFTVHFQPSIQHGSNYKKDTCTLTSVQIYDVIVDCDALGDDIVYETSQLCIVGLVQTRNQTKIPIYRNYFEKMWSIKKQHDNQDGLKCSYLPSKCDLDPSITKSLLSRMLPTFFPKTNYTFQCYVSNTKGDVLLHMTDYYAYYLSLVVLSIGVAIGIGLMLYGVKGSIVAKLRRPHFKRLLRNMLADENMVIPTAVPTYDESQIVNQNKFKHNSYQFSIESDNGSIGRVSGRVGPPCYGSTPNVSRKGCSNEQLNDENDKQPLYHHSFGTYLTTPTIYIHRASIVEPVLDGDESDGSVFENDERDVIELKTIQIEDTLPEHVDQQLDQDLKDEAVVMEQVTQKDTAIA